MENTNLAAEKKYNKWIVFLSVVIPLVVAALFGVNLRDLGYDVAPLTFLPPIYASINGLTALILVIAVWAIKNKKVALHKKLMTTAIACSVVFLVMYVAYHMTSNSTSYGGEGVKRSIYFFILFTHIILSIIIIPFVLITYVRAITNNFERHKKIARITFPMWLYVAVTGVIVYIMISPYYV
jgi:putative membrane protein